MDEAVLVSIVDDDVSMRQSLPILVRGFGFKVLTFACAEDFLASECVGRTKCLVLDIAMPGMSGPDLQRELTRQGRRIPIVFITGQADPGIRQQLLADGAVACLFKPFSALALREAVNTALGVN
jgi:FixJ family two-component response regulator